MPPRTRVRSGLRFGARSGLRAAGLRAAGLSLIVAVAAACGTGAATPSAAGASGTAVAATALPSAASTIAGPAFPPDTPAPASAEPVNAGGMQLSFVGLTDGGTVAGTLNAKGRPLVTVRLKVTGGAPLDLWLSANGLLAVDEVGRGLSQTNKSGTTPWTVEIPWSPPSGGGAYTLTATVIDNNKNQADATIHITVTGVPTTTLPPALTQQQATAEVTKLISDKYKVRIPSPSLQRFDFPTNPTRSRWIGAAYYKGTRYYVQIFDDGHVEWSTGPYADAAHRAATGMYTWCRPAGNYRVLVVFVDYGNTGTVRETALAQVPPVVAWLNGLYADFAAGQGYSSPLMTIAADAAYVSPPPARGQLLTTAQIRTLTGKDPAAYDFLMQIDLDVNGTFGTRNYPGLIEAGGGLALNACGGSKSGATNIWSSVTDAREVQGGLTMDFNHELSHMFGMMDDWPYRQGVAGPGGSIIDDWIPYVMFGWSDADGDGIPEILDSTPYGTAGPKP
jgi:hypothetical protein